MTLTRINKLLTSFDGALLGLCDGVFDGELDGALLGLLEGGGGAAQAVSPPETGSPAEFIVPSGQSTQILPDTYSFSLHVVGQVDEVASE